MPGIQRRLVHLAKSAPRFVFLAAAGAILGAAAMATWDGVNVFGPLRMLARRSVTSVLGMMLAGYLAILPLSLLGMIISGWMAWGPDTREAKGPGPRRVCSPRPAASLWLLLCGSIIVAITLAEAVSAAWLAWIHRLPALPGRAVVGSRPVDEVSIAVIGGSSALGVPYEGWLSVGTMVGRELGHVFPNRRFRVEILARRGATLEDQHQKLARLPHAPDILIVYSGHNEFVTRFSWLHRGSYYDDDSFAGRHWDALQRFAAISPLFRLLRENLEKQRVGLIPTRMFGPRETLIGRPVCTREETAAIEADFRRRLGAIVADCERIGCLPILIIPPSCETWDPNQSYGSASMRQDQREALFRRLTAIRDQEPQDPAGAIAEYRAILEAQPTLAEAHFRLARQLQAIGAFAQARDHYILARDHDGLPMRCTTPLEAAYRSVVRRSAHGILVDGPEVLRAVSHHGILNHGLFHDNVHPTLTGHVALAEAVLRQLKGRGALGWPESTPAPSLDVTRCAVESGLDDRAWSAVCDRTIDQLNLIAFLPFDPAERVRLRDRYIIAANRLRAGIPPESAGIPGVRLDQAAYRPE
jgi:hypothetical protein